MPSLDIDAIKHVLAKREPVRDDVAVSHAAVAIVLREEHVSIGPELLLIRRAQREGDPWSGHIALPGGRRQKDDPTLLHTAMRETREEVGLDLEGAGDLLGALDEMPAMARGERVGLSVAPFVFTLRETRTLRVDPREVDEALWVPIVPYFNGEQAITVPYDHHGTTLMLPAFRAGDHVLWGMTYKMLSQFFELLRKR